ncbi:hypothetical protein CGRA01v4_07908 [Colletotrichum graminicola]|uniref:Uncharacterized protein n=1 Tax=Colletotrichum graminicola (strain M1.001 / M2 / FGSC 10212) TaxID=645133 RepID=E3Q7Q5_COLGM|nr:uncharacterized protein GLRG_02088 [Colletotrichum graminicola M1.001]EFQ26917.1 hypothetical protein GLRG_02088 [Colletotrichum graminicola M1.001]WDK16625.1 hypothetical protein CGRA01v4_07908 [Colletotrichum graminicola]
MSATAPDCLVPDLTILSGISELDGITMCKYRIISNSSTTCTAVASLEEDQSPCGLPTHLIIRLEKSRDGNPLFATAAFQRLAHRRLPHLVPKVWGAGHTQTEKGAKISYMLSQYYMDTCTLESVWDDMDKFSRHALVEQVVSNLVHLKDVSVANVNDETEILRGTPFERTKTGNSAMVGGPAYGYFRDFSSFLMSTLSSGSKRYSIDRKPDGTLAIQMKSPQETGFGFAQTDLDLLLHMSVLCHNNLEPRNILVRKVITSNNRVTCQLVSVIGWEMAGFFPFAFEVGYKDTCLGLQNQSWSWYSWYRLSAGRILSGTAPAARPICFKLIQSMVLTDIAKKEANKLNVGNLVQKLWHEREQTMAYVDAETGYAKNPNIVGVNSFNMTDNAELELEALRKLRYID